MKRVADCAEGHSAPSRFSFPTIRCGVAGKKKKKNGRNGMETLGLLLIGFFARCREGRGPPEISARFSRQSEFGDGLPAFACQLYFGANLRPLRKRRCFLSLCSKGGRDLYFCKMTMPIFVPGTCTEVVSSLCVACYSDEVVHYYKLRCASTTNSETKFVLVLQKGMMQPATSHTAAKRCVSPGQSVAAESERAVR